MKSRILVLIALLVICITANSQNWEWVITGSSPTGWVEPTKPVIDSAGNVYVAGNYFGDFTIADTTLTMHGESDIFVAKFDSTGNLLWAHAYGSIEEDRINDIAIDPYGNLFIIGKCSTRIQFDTFSLNETSYSQSFFMKINSEGEVSWAKIEGNNQNDYVDNDYLISIGIDHIGNTYMTGIVDTTIYYQEHPMIEPRVHVSKYDNEGNLQWIKLVQDEWMEFYDINVNANFINIANYGGTNQNLLNYDFSGNLVNQREFEYPNTVENFSTGLDNNIFFSKVFSENITYDSRQIIPQGTNDFLIGKFDSNNTFSLIEQASGSGSLQISDIEVNNYIYATGTYSHSMTFDTVELVSNRDENNSFILKYDTNGEIIWAKQDEIESTSYISVQNEQIYISGAFSEFGFLDHFELNPQGTTDMYIGKLGCTPAQPTEIIGETMLCAGTYYYSTESQIGSTFEWEISGGGTLTENGNEAIVQWETAGTYTLTVTPLNNCGSGQSQSITVEVKDIPRYSELTGDSIVCRGSEVYSVPFENDVIYSWNLSGGGTSLGIDNTIAINWLSTGTYNITLNASNMCGAGEPLQQLITVMDIPTQPDDIIGNTTTCLGTQAYNINSEPMVDYFWRLSSGGTILQSQNFATVNWTASGDHMITVIPENLCGTGPSQNISIHVNSVPNQPTTIIGNSNICLGNQSYSVLQESGISYSWDISGGGAIIENGNSADVLWTTPGQYTVSVTPSNNCGNGQSRTQTIEVYDVPDEVETIFGLDTVCLGSQEYSVAASMDTYYTWSLSDGGFMIPEENRITITWETPGNHTITVLPANTCGNGTPVSKTVFVRNSTASVSSISGNGNPCLTDEQYQVPLTTGIDYEWSIDGGGTISFIDNTAMVQWEETGYYNIVVESSDGCAYNKSIEVNDIPEATTQIVGDTATCLANRSYSVSAINDVEYLWEISRGGILTSYANAAQVSWSDEGSHELSVTPTNNCGSGPITTTTISVYDIPTMPSVIVGNDSVCIATETYSVNAEQGCSYNWWIDNQNGVIASNNNSIDIHWQETGTNVINVSYTNACGTGAVQTLPILISDIPEKPEITGDTLICIGTSIYSIEEINLETYNWSVSPAATISENTNNSIAIDWQTPGTYLISVTPENYCGTGETATIVVEVIDVPSLNTPISGENTVCQTTEIYSVTAEENVNYDWSTDGGGVLSEVENSVMISWVTPGLYMLSVIPANMCGQGQEQTMNVQVKGLPEQPDTIFGADISCLESQTYNVNAIDRESYQWVLSGGGNISAIGNTATIEWTSTGSHTITVIPYSDCGNGISISKTVLVKNIPNQPIFEDTENTVCPGTKHYSVLYIPDVTYNWNTTSSDSFTVLNNTATTIWSTSGTSEISVSAENMCGISTVTSISITIGTVPNALSDIDGDTLVCLTTNSYTTETVNAINYNWNLSGGGYMSSTENTSQITWTTPGTYSLSVTPENECGEGENTTATIIVRDIPSQPAAIIGDRNACIHDTLIYSVSASSYVDNYIWEISEGADVDTNFNVFSTIWTMAGEHIISVVPQNTCGEGVSRSLSVNVKDSPQPVTFTSGDTLACIGNETYMVNSVPDLTYIWQVSGNNNIIANNNTATVTWNNTGQYSITVSTENECGSSPSTSKTVQTISVPNKLSDIRGDTIVCTGTELYTTNFEEYIDYNWHLNGGGSLMIQDSSVIINWNIPGTYNLIVTPINQCGNGVQTVQTIYVNSIPTQPLLIEGNAKACLNSTEEYTVYGATNQNYIWNVSNIDTIDAIGLIAHINWTEEGISTINVYAENACGTSPSLQKEILVYGHLAQDLTHIIGDTLVCIDDICQYSVLYTENTFYNWILDSSIIYNEFNNSIFTEWNHPDNYKIAVSAYNRCNTTDTIELNIKVEEYSATPVISYRNDSLFSNIENGNQWFFNDEPIKTANSNYLIPVKSGEYYTIVSNSCSETYESNKLYITDNSNAAQGVHIYPIPASDYLYVTMPVNLDWREINLYSSSGVLVNSYKKPYPANDDIAIYVHEFDAGSYIIEIVSTTGRYSKKIEIEH